MTRWEKGEIYILLATVIVGGVISILDLVGALDSVIVTTYHPRHCEPPKAVKQSPGLWGDCFGGYCRLAMTAGR